MHWSDRQRDEWRCLHIFHLVDRCQVRINGDMMLSFPAGLVQLMNAQPNHNIPPISFRIRNFLNLDSIVPNKQVLTM